VANQRLLILDELPILLSSGCEFRSCRGSRVGCKDLARDTRATTDVVAASLCEAWRRPQGDGYILKIGTNKNALSDFFRQGVLRGILF
jgi:hypothetical protein